MNARHPDRCGLRPRALSNLGGSFPLSSSCIFCAIAAGQAPCHPFWEDDHHLAFLSIYPNTEGFSLVIPKIHQPSYVVQMDTDAYLALHLAAREAARCLDNAFEDVARTGIMYEGYGVDHAHAKLFPCTAQQETKAPAGEPCTP